MTTPVEGSGFRSWLKQAFSKKTEKGAGPSYAPIDQQKGKAAEQSKKVEKVSTFSFPNPLKSLRKLFSKPAQTSGPGSPYTEKKESSTVTRASVPTKQPASHPIRTAFEHLNLESKEKKELDLADRKCKSAFEFLEKLKSERKPLQEEKVKAESAFRDAEDALRVRSTKDNLENSTAAAKTLTDLLGQINQLDDDIEKAEQDLNKAQKEYEKALTAYNK